MAGARIAVLAGGLSHERYISLESGREVQHALKTKGFDAGLYDVDASLFEKLEADNVSCAVNVLHGAGGEDGGIQAGLELFGIPYVGTTAKGCRRGWDKIAARVNLERLGLPTPTWLSVSSERLRELGFDRVSGGLQRELGYPLVIKPANSGSAYGLQLVTDTEALHQGIANALSYGGDVLFEAAAPGREVSIVVVDDEGEPRTLTPTLLKISEAGRFDYQARHDPGQIDYQDFSEVDPEMATTLKQVAIDAHRGLGLRDISRTDVIVGHNGEFTVLEVSISPGLTRASSATAAMEMSGTSLANVMGALVQQRL